MDEAIWCRVKRKLRLAADVLGEESLSHSHGRINIESLAEVLFHGVEKLINGEDTGASSDDTSSTVRVGIHSIENDPVAKRIADMSIDTVFEGVRAKRKESEHIVEGSETTFRDVRREHHKEVNDLESKNEIDGDHVEGMRGSVTDLFFIMSCVENLYAC